MHEYVYAGVGGCLAMIYILRVIAGEPISIGQLAVSSAFQLLTLRGSKRGELWLLTLLTAPPRATPSRENHGWSGLPRWDMVGYVRSAIVVSYPRRNYIVAVTSTPR